MEHLLGFGAFCFGLVVVAWLALGSRRIASILLVAFLARAFLALVHSYIVPLPDSQADAVMFERIAQEWSASGWSTIVQNWQTGAFLYSWLISVLYFAVGRSPLMVQALNVLIGTLIVYLVYRLVEEGSGYRTAQRAAWVAALFPTLNLYSALTMREAIVVFLALLGVLETLRWTRALRVQQFSWAIAFLAFAGAFHTGMLVLLLVPGMLALTRWISAVLGRKGEVFLRTTASLTLIVVAGITIALTGWGLEKVGLMQEGLGAQQAVAARDRAAYLATMTVQQPSDLVWQTPVRVLFFLFTPFPWWIRQPGDVLGVMDAVIYLWLTILAWRGRRRLFRNPYGRVLTAFLATGVVVFALATSNYGTAIRHRAKFAPLLIAVAMTAQHKPIFLPRPQQTFKEEPS